MDFCYLPAAAYFLSGCLFGRQIAPITAKFNKSLLNGKNSIRFCIDEDKLSSNKYGKARPKFWVIKVRIHKIQRLISIDQTFSTNNRADIEPIQILN